MSRLHPNSPPTYLLVGTPPEDAQDEDRCHWGGQGAGHGLHVDEDLPTVRALQDGDPGHAHANEHDDDQPVSRQRVCWLQRPFLYHSPHPIPPH